MKSVSGATHAQNLTREGAPSSAGLTLWSTPSPWIDVITDGKGAMAPAYPTLASLPLAGTSSFQFVGIAVTGNTAVYTVPSGKYATLNTISVVNTAGSSQSLRTWVSPDLGTTRYCTASNQTVANGASANLTTNGYVYLPGDSIIIETPSLGTVQVSGCGYLWDMASSPFLPIVYRGLPTGDTTVYTCPAGKTATTLGASPSFIVEAGGPRFSQHSIGGVTIVYTQKWSIGGTTATTTIQAVSHATVGAAPASAFVLSAGDTIVVNADSYQPASHYWLLLAEYPTGILASAPSAPLAVAAAEREMKYAEEPPDDWEEEI